MTGDCVNISISQGTNANKHLTTDRLNLGTVTILLLSLLILHRSEYYYYCCGSQPPPQTLGTVVYCGFGGGPDSRQHITIR